MDYSKEELSGIYELGKMYFEMGFFVPAERIFSGLIGIEGSMIPARLGLGLIKLERGLYQEATLHFRQVLQSGSYAIHAKLGLVSAFIGMQEMSRARSLIAEIAKELPQHSNVGSEIRMLAQAFAVRCGAEGVR